MVKARHSPHSEMHGVKPGLCGKHRYYWNFSKNYSVINISYRLNGSRSFHDTYIPKSELGNENGIRPPLATTLFCCGY
ncbi:hypothetical protein KsCSTR_45300 [Candidatus Kuenenia stuttgartiensis]|uniref:Uncharacterized protein n=1 Tax=Kuenenia stuttgartiensis TaxID=174633 RepID=Q1PWK7_KUEST|nr:hypothetical protein KsCSTR_45300 [Candidatus Kuenenia stuttgartiensis]CAJ71606.1 unknown protein [Candidatus Kuenenia stuttgartiensis]